MYLKTFSAFLVSLIVPSAVSAAQLTHIELRQATLKPVTEHKTEKGVIVCRDPQVQFNEEVWLDDLLSKGLGTGGLIREHMLVDLVVHERLSNKSRSYVDKLFQKQALVDGDIVRYSLFCGSGKCGNVPQLDLEVSYDKDGNVLRYRSRYREDGGSEASTNSEWVK